MSEHDTEHEQAIPSGRLAARLEWALEGVMQEAYQISHRVHDQEQFPDDEGRLLEIEALLMGVVSSFELDTMQALQRKHAGA